MANVSFITVVAVVVVFTVATSSYIKAFLDTSLVALWATLNVKSKLSYLCFILSHFPFFLSRVNPFFCHQLLFPHRQLRLDIVTSFINNLA